MLNSVVTILFFPNAVNIGTFTEMHVRKERELRGTFLFFIRDM